MTTDKCPERERNAAEVERLWGLLGRAKYFIENYECYPLDDHPDQARLIDDIDAARAEREVQR